MHTHLRTALLFLAPALAAAALAPAAGAATFQQGQMRFTVSGSWVASGPANIDCRDAGGEDRQIQYPVTERVTFKGTSAGRISYRGLVGRSIFFERIGARPRLKISVSRTATPPAGCQPATKTDCGERKLEGVANPEFEGPFRSGGRVKLSFDFARTKTSFRFADPYEQCALPSAGPDWWARAMSPTGGDFDFQEAALDVPSPKRFYAKRRQTFSGSATRRFKGDPGIGVGPSTATLRMKVGVSRRVTRSQPAFRG